MAVGGVKYCVNEELFRVSRQFTPRICGLSALFRDSSTDLVRPADRFVDYLCGRERDWLPFLGPEASKLGGEVIAFSVSCFAVGQDRLGCWAALGVEGDGQDQAAAAVDPISLSGES